MANIQLVIQIDEEDYKTAIHNVEVGNPLSPLSQKEMVTKIADGVRLTKSYYEDLPHGEWIRGGNKIGYADTIKCSVCNRSLIWEDNEPIAFVYCPWCGAKLKDTEKENENKSM